MVILYSTDCPRCKTLEGRLKEKGIEFEKNTTFDKKEMIAKGFVSIPLLEVDGNIMTYPQAVAWIGER